ncbi:hypothetical protein [Mariniflexile sp. AS56]|uniref:hypothetical protein n=1 Tax=Mariniflexile sp. AS56 TaxID=3063957 RepID=UPI0026EF803C|nr:hypothetical protein [Mariniflexile sp. AS56]MDO7171754.1 hypothetical protein [Mariniflexile sp. AS56]
MDYFNLSKEGVLLLTTLIKNEENGIATSSEKVERLISVFDIISEATDKLLLQSERQSKIFQDLKNQTHRILLKFQKEKENLEFLIHNYNISIVANDEARKKFQRELQDIKIRIAEAQAEIEKLKPKIEFKWYWVFCWWCGLIAAGVNNEINSRLSEIEQIQLNADQLQSSIVNNDINKFKQAIIDLKNKLATEQKELDKIALRQKEIDDKMQLFSSKLKSSVHIKGEVKFIGKSLENFYKEKEIIGFLKNRLESTANFCDGHSHKKMPMEKILSDWGNSLNEELLPSGASVQAVRLAIDGKEFGHFRKISDSNWELVGTSKFDAYKNDPIAQILSKGPFIETQRDRWSIYLHNDSHNLAVDIWKSLVSATHKNTKEILTTEIIDGSLAEKVHFHPQDHITPAAVAALCKQNNWRLASEFEVSIAWIHNGLNVPAFGQIKNDLVVVPIQSDTNTWLKRGLNTLKFGSTNSGNQGFFYINNQILTFRKLKPAI